MAQDHPSHLKIWKTRSNFTGGTRFFIYIYIYIIIIGSLSSLGNCHRIELRKIVRTEGFGECEQDNPGNEGGRVIHLDRLPSGSRENSEK